MKYSDEDILKLKKEPYVDLDFAKVDVHRKVRQGVSEVIYGAGKTKEQILEIAGALLKNGDETILITRINEDAKDYVVHGLGIEDVLYEPQARVCVLGKLPQATGHGTIVVVTGGTSDIPVAEEAAVTAMALGNDVKRIYDVGVAGIHRLFHYLDELMTASVIIAVAGMEGALASVVGGLVSCPVIAVPTSVGYGASFQGLSALLSMLNSCASGVSVVNIDNGFGAGYQASLINHVAKGGI
ncbi:MAG: nickel pincer cofactor biosynthesis protein LarB [Clostridium sp.]|nr:nickel pincer cofactor biosynthesis protein LarB [Clostridium sp.]MCM1399482.1 nickel pincer cofactor biosynthesis protein LarB [Clostridium sp.]MCM1460036.1 nickel pincer cofactor biosynthesis protein LarB [Bacteroides sp.]